LQRAALKSAGCKKIFTDDGLSGATIKRPALLRCLKTLKGADLSNQIRPNIELYERERGGMRFVLRPILWAL
jgi:hypothetical protein